MNQAGISICVQTVLWGHKNVPIFATSGAGINVKRIFKENLLGMLLLYDPNCNPAVCCWPAREVTLVTLLKKMLCKLIVAKWNTFKLYYLVHLLRYVKMEIFLVWFCLLSSLYFWAGGQQNLKQLHRRISSILSKWNYSHPLERIWKSMYRKIALALESKLSGG